MHRKGMDDSKSDHTIKIRERFTVFLFFIYFEYK